MRRRTPARAKAERLYLARRTLFLAENPWCRKCGQRADTIQHAAGRRGSLLLDERYWIPLCWNPCHMWVEAHPIEAEKQGLRVSRTSPACLVVVAGQAGTR